MTQNLEYERRDYSMVVKNTGWPVKPWRWEIYRAGNARAIKKSTLHYETMQSARQAGKEALKVLLDKLFA